MCACMWVYACLYACVRVHTYMCGYVHVGEFVGVGACACAHVCVRCKFATHCWDHFCVSSFGAFAGPNNSHRRIQK